MVDSHGPPKCTQVYKSFRFLLILTDLASNISKYKKFFAKMSRTLPSRFSLRKKRPNSPEICISGDFGRFRATSGAQNRPKFAPNSPEMPEIYFGRSKYGIRTLYSPPSPSPNSTEQNRYGFLLFYWRVLKVSVKLKQHKADHTNELDSLLLCVYPQNSVMCIFLLCATRDFMLYFSRAPIRGRMGL